MTGLKLFTDTPPAQGCATASHCSQGVGAEWEGCWLQSLSFVFNFLCVLLLSHMPSWGFESLSGQQVLLYLQAHFLVI